MRLKRSKVKCPGCGKEKRPHVFDYITIYQCTTCNTVFKIQGVVCYETEVITDCDAGEVLW